MIPNPTWKRNSIKTCTVSHTLSTADKNETFDRYRMLSHISAVFHRYQGGTQLITRSTTQHHSIVLRSAISRSLPEENLKISSSPVSQQLRSMSVWEWDDEHQEWIMQLLFFPQCLHYLPSDPDLVTASSHRPIDWPIEDLLDLTGFWSLSVLPQHPGLSVALWWDCAEWEDRRMLLCHSDERMRLNGLTDRLYLQTH